METPKKVKTIKIKRSFTIEPDLFYQFKSEVAKHGTTYSTILESLISLFLKQPNKFNLFQ